MDKTLEACNQASWPEAIMWIAVCVLIGFVMWVLFKD